MRRPALLALAFVAALAVGGIVWLRRGPKDAAPETTVSGTVTGRYGTVWNVRIEARDGERVLAGTWTSYLGVYSLDVPPGVPFDLHAIPIPETLLIAEHRPLALRRGEKRIEAFDLKSIPVTEGVVVSPVPDPWIRLSAVREDAPKGAPRQARGAAVRDTRFRFWGLETGAPYRLEVPSPGWSLERPVVFRGGDSGIVASLRRMLLLDLRVQEAGTGKDMPLFTVKVVKPDGGVFATLEGRDGRLHWQVPHPDPEEPLDRCWSIRVAADGYFEEALPRMGYRVCLQPVRASNITLRVHLADGSPYEGPLAARGVSHRNYANVNARAVRIEAGRYEAVLPPGRWWFYPDAGPLFGNPRCDVVVADEEPAIIDVPPLVRRKPAAGGGQPVVIVPLLPPGKRDGR